MCIPRVSSLPSVTTATVAVPAIMFTFTTSTQNCVEFPSSRVSVLSETLTSAEKRDVKYEIFISAMMYPIYSGHGRCFNIVSQASRIFPASERKMRRKTGKYFRFPPLTSSTRGEKYGWLVRLVLI